MNEGSAAGPRAPAQSSADAIRRAAAQFFDLLGLDSGPAASQGQAIQVHAASYVTIRLAAAMTGYSVRAIEAKIDRADWVEGREWLRSPDGRRLISMAGYARWVESGHAR